MMRRNALSRIHADYPPEWDDPEPPEDGEEVEDDGEPAGFLDDDPGDDPRADFLYDPPSLNRSCD